MFRLLAILILTTLLAMPARATGLAVQITNISDLNLGSWSIGDPGISSYIDVCIAATVTVPLGDYAITVTGGSGGYVLTSGSNQIPYTLSWESSGAGNLGTSSGTQLSNGVLLDDQPNAYTLVPFCINGNNARLHIKITQAAMTAALAGTYSGTIILMVSPP
jgi:hypothetical protein